MSRSVRVEHTWRLLMRDLGVSEPRVLRRAGQPADLFTREQATVSPEAYFRMWDALEAESGLEDFPLVVGQAFSGEMFSPPLFAALCSPDLDTAAERVGRYKRLLGPFRLDVERDAHGTRLTFGCLSVARPPPGIGTMEVVFWLHFVRTATRSPIRPSAVTLPHRLPRPAPYRDYFGIPVGLGAGYTLTFSELDARRPFLTGDARMWAFFEPELRRRLVELEGASTVVERVESALVELLPSGRSAIGDVARELGCSSRTLQRWLGREQVRYQGVLDRTRERLARHYLRSSSMSSAEISFLLGYEDPNSFFRAFHRWTGSTPRAVRTGG